ncbi:replicative DNA helicase, partial [Staphylococcus epidermidis]
VDNAIDMLSPDVFYKKQHQLIYQAIFELFNQSLPIDLITVSEQLRKDGNLEAAGGELYLINLTQRVSSSANVEFHAQLILQTFIKRRL